MPDAFNICDATHQQVLDVPSASSSRRPVSWRFLHVRFVNTSPSHFEHLEAKHAWLAAMSQGRHTLRPLHVSPSIKRFLLPSVTGLSGSQWKSGSVSTEEPPLVGC